MNRIALTILLLAQPVVAQSVPGIVREFHHTSYSESGRVKGVMGYISLAAPTGEDLRDVVIEFSGSNPNSSPQDKIELARRVPLVEGGTVRTIGFHLDGLTEFSDDREAVQACLSWTSGGSRHDAQASSVQQFPLRVPIEDYGLPPELLTHLSNWEKTLSEAARELRMKHGLRCDFWSHRFGQSLKYDGYTIGIEVALVSSESQYDTAGISIDLRSLASDPRLVRAGVLWDGRTPPWMGSPIFEDRPMTAASLDEVDALLETWIGELSEGVKLGEPPNEGSVLKISTLATVENKQETVALLDGEAYPNELDLWQCLFSQLYPNLDGEPILLWGSSTQVDNDSPIARLWEPRKLERLPGVSLGLLRKHAEVNQQRLMVPTDFMLAGKGTILATWEGEPRDFFRIYRASPGTFAFSRPAYSDDGRMALLSCLKWDCVEMSRNLCLLAKEGETWNLVANLDEMELFYELDLGDHTEIARISFQDGMDKAGITVLESDFSNWPKQRARIRVPDGRELDVLNDRWISEFLLARRGEKPEMDYFLCSRPLLVLGSVDASKVVDAVKRPWEYHPDEITGEMLIKDLDTEGSPSVESLTYLGSHGSAEQYDQIHFFRATLIDGAPLVFPVIGVSWRSSEPRPLERLIVMNGFSGEKLLKAVEAYLDQSATGPKTESNE